MEEITKKLIDYKTNYWFRDPEYEEQLQKELQAAILADFYGRLFNVYTMIFLFIKIMIINFSLNYLVGKFCRYFTYIMNGEKQECWGIRIFFYILGTPYITNILLESLDLYKEKYW